MIHAYGGVDPSAVLLTSSSVVPFVLDVIDARVTNVVASEIDVLDDGEYATVALLRLDVELAVETVLPGERVVAQRLDRHDQSGLVLRVQLYFAFGFDRGANAVIFQCC